MILSLGKHFIVALMVLFFANGLGMVEQKAWACGGGCASEVEVLCCSLEGSVADFSLEEGYFHTTDMLNSTTDVGRSADRPKGYTSEKVRS